MSHFIFCILLFAASSLFADDTRHILIPSHAKEISSSLKGVGNIFVAGDSALLEVPSSEIETVASLIHDKLGGCGGFFDVTAELSDGENPDVLLSKMIRPTRIVPYFEFAPVVKNTRLAESLSMVNAKTIESFLSELSGFEDRSASTDNGTRAADFIAQRAIQIGGQRNGFSVRKVTTRTYPKQPSVVATLVGKNPSMPHVVIGAHMDTLSYNKPGADDDGSGSSVVMEALRVVTEDQMEFERTIDFVWYAAEERGLVGSSNVVKDFQKNSIQVAAAIQFDMTGWVNPAGVHDIYLTDDYINPSLNLTLEKIIQTYLPELSVGHASCGYACSDHATWTANDIPAVYPFESHHNDYNRRIHTSSDKMDYLSLGHMSNFAKIALAFLGQMANFQ